MELVGHELRHVDVAYQKTESGKEFADCEKGPGRHKKTVLKRFQIQKLIC